MSTIMNARSRRATRAAITIAAALAWPALLASCADSPTIPLARVSREITSGTVPGGQRSLFFLTRPMDRGKFTGTFDGTLNPQVLVCSEPRCVTPVLGPIGLASTGPATLTLDRVRQSYVFRWQTKGGPLAPNAVYRLVVRVGDYQLGWVDLATGTKQRDLRAVNHREFVPLRLGTTLVLPFRIEQGAPFPPDLPGRYESTPDECPPGACFIHFTPEFVFFEIWAAVQITQTGTAKTGMIFYGDDRVDPPVVPPIPAPGTGPLDGAADPSEDLTNVTLPSTTTTTAVLSCGTAVSSGAAGVGVPEGRRPSFRSTLSSVCFLRCIGCRTTCRRCSSPLGEYDTARRGRQIAGRVLLSGPPVR